MPRSSLARLLPAASIASGLLLSAATVAVSGQSSPPSPTQAPSPAPSPAAPRIPAIFVPPEPLNFAEREGWTSLFDGRTLAGWDGNPDVWSVEAATITARSTAERRIGSTHIIWSGGEPADFELKLEMKLEGDIHSGIAYRSYVDLNRGSAGRQAGAGTGGGAGAAAGATSGARAGAGAGAARGNAPALGVPANPKWTLYGPGLDYDYDRLLAGNVEDRGSPRREVAWRGGMARAEPGVRPRLVGSLGDPDALMAKLKADDWNEIHIIARGHQLTHIVNGHVMTILTDDDPQYFRPAGLIGLQIEQYGLGRVSFRDIWLKQIKP